MKIEECSSSRARRWARRRFPRGPYRFHNREYLNITYRTDADALRAVVPEPLEIDEPLVRFEVMQHARRHRPGQLHRMRAGDRRRASARSAASTCTRCTSTATRRSPAGARSARIRRSSARPSSTSTPTRWSARSTTAALRVAVATMGYKHQLDDGRGRARRDLRADLHAEDAARLRPQAAHLRAGAHADHRRRRSSAPGAARRGCSCSSMCWRRWPTCRCARSSRPATSWPT